MNAEPRRGANADGGDERSVGAIGRHRGLTDLAAGHRRLLGPGHPGSVAQAPAFQACLALLRPVSGPPAADQPQCLSAQVSGVCRRRDHPWGIARCCPLSAHPDRCLRYAVRHAVTGGREPQRVAGRSAGVGRVAQRRVVACPAVGLSCRQWRTCVAVPGRKCRIGAAPTKRCRVVIGSPRRDGTIYRAIAWWYFTVTAPRGPYLPSGQPFYVQVWTPADPKSRFRIIHISDRGGGITTTSHHILPAFEESQPPGRSLSGTLPAEVLSVRGVCRS